MGALQNFADTINNGGGINLSNLGANSDLLSGLASLVGSGGGGGTNTGPSLDLSSLASNAGLLGNLAGLLGGGGGGGGTAGSAGTVGSAGQGQGQGISDLVGNLLTGFVGNRFSGRKVSKRSIETFATEDTENATQNSDIDSEPEKKMSLSKRKLAETIKKEKRREIVDDDVEARIINSKPQIYANDDNEDDGPLRFTFYSHRDSKKLSSNEPYVAAQSPTTSNGNPFVSFHSSQENANDDDNDVFRIPSVTRAPTKLHFQNFESENGPNFNSRPNQFFPTTTDTDTMQDPYDEPNLNSQPNQFFTANNNVGRDSYDDRGHSTKMIFPDRTGTGNLKFDNDAFGSTGHRFGKILNGGGNRYPQASHFTATAPNDNRISFDGATTNSNYRYESNRRPQQYYQQSTSAITHQPNRIKSQNQNQYYGNIFNAHSQRQHTATASNINNNNNNNSNRYGNQNSRPNSGNDNSSQNIYVTNSKGIIEYYIDPNGQKHYV